MEDCQVDYYCECCGVVPVVLDGIYCDGCCNEICEALALEDALYQQALDRHQDLQYSYAAQLYSF
jgi:hypothetical protein